MGRDKSTNMKAGILAIIVCGLLLTVSFSGCEENVPAKEKGEVLAAFAAHKAEVNVGYFAKGK